jgi:hypothetical protein
MRPQTSVFISERYIEASRTRVRISIAPDGVIGRGLFKIDSGTFPFLNRHATWRITHLTQVTMFQH